MVNRGGSAANAARWPHRAKTESEGPLRTKTAKHVARPLRDNIESKESSCIEPVGMVVRLTLHRLPTPNSTSTSSIHFDNYGTVTEERTNE